MTHLIQELKSKIENGINNELKLVERQVKQIVKRHKNPFAFLSALRTPSIYYK